MNSENENNNNEFYKAMADLSLPQLEERARRAGCKLEVEFDITQGQNGDDDTFQEGGTFVATYVPIPEEIEMLTDFIMAEDSQPYVNWPSEEDALTLDIDFNLDFNLDFDSHLNGICEEDFQEYDKIAGDIDIKLSADMELKEDIVKWIENHDVEKEIDLPAFIKEIDDMILEDIIEKSRAIEAFDKAKIDPEAF